MEITVPPQLAFERGELITALCGISEAYSRADSHPEDLDATISMARALLASLR